MKKVVLFSAMTGQLLMHGEPIRYAKIRRVVNFGETPEDDLTDYTETDGEGRFSFDEKSHRGFSNYLLVQFACLQQLFVTIGGIEQEFWSAVKMDEEANAESRGKPLNAVCELSMKELDFKKINRNSFQTKCDWGEESDPQKEYGFDNSLFDDDEEVIG